MNDASHNSNQPAANTVGPIVIHFSYTSFI